MAQQRQLAVLRLPLQQVQVKRCMREGGREERSFYVGRLSDAEKWRLIPVMRQVRHSKAS